MKFFYFCLFDRERSSVIYVPKLGLIGYLFIKGFVYYRIGVFGSIGYLCLFFYINTKVCRSKDFIRNRVFCVCVYVLIVILGLILTHN